MVCAWDMLFKLRHLHIYIISVLWLFSAGCGGSPDEEIIQKDYVQALHYYQSQDFDQSQALLTAILEKDPAFLNALLLKGKVYFYQKKYDLASNMFLKVLSESPHHVSAKLWQAKALYAKSGNTKEVSALLDEILAIDSDNIEAWYLKGLIYERAGDMENAVAAYRAALNQSGKLGLVHLRMADLYKEADLENQAAKHLSIAKVLGAEE